MSARHKLFTIGAGILVAFSLVTLYTPTKPALPPSLTKTSFQPTSSQNHPRFIDKTLEIGFHAEHRQRDHGISGLDQITGGGACTLDYDQDGWLDILFVGGSGTGHYFGHPEWWQTGVGNVLYRNMQGKRFAAQPGAIPDTLFWGMDCVSADFDQDGDPDIFLATKGENQLWLNEAGRFIHQELPSSINKSASWTRSAAVADINADGLPDIYLVNYVNYAPDKKYLEGAFGFGSLKEALFQPGLFEPQPDQMLLNQGKLEFKDITQSAALTDAAGRGVQAIWSDLNADGREDLVVINDTRSANRVFVNQGNNQFRDRSAYFGIGTTESLKSAHILDSAADLDNPTDRGLIFIGGNARKPISAVQISAAGFLGELPTYGDLQAVTEVTQSIGSADFNLDGLADLYLANGLETPDIDSDSHAQGQRDRILLGQQDGSYIECKTACLPKMISSSSRKVLIADFDQDGDMDVFVTANNDLPTYLENQLISGSAPKSKTALRLSDESLRLQAAQWLADDQRLDLAVREYTLLSHSAAEDIAISALRQLQDINTERALAPAVKALRHSQANVRQAAVKVLQAKEVDYTGRYLISMLWDKGERVVCAAAQALGHFYDEEEAMIRAKYRATSVLAELAEKQAAEVQPCIIHALGKSEHYRALAPLLQLTRADNREVQLASIAALGHINEQGATKRLQALATDPSKDRQIRQAADTALALLQREGSATQARSPLAYVQTSQRLPTIAQNRGQNHPCQYDSQAESDYRKASGNVRKKLMQDVLNKSEASEFRNGILRGFLPQPLFSEYRIALSIFQDTEDPIRYCAAYSLMAYNAASHIDTLRTELDKTELSDLQRMQLADAIRSKDPESAWKHLIKEEDDE